MVTQGLDALMLFIGGKQLRRESLRREGVDHDMLRVPRPSTSSTTSSRVRRRLPPPSMILGRGVVAGPGSLAEGRIRLERRSSSGRIRVSLRPYPAAQLKRLPEDLDRCSHHGKSRQGGHVPS